MLQLTTNNVGELLVTYESYINASLTMDKTDRELMSTWTAEFQVKQVNVTSHYRLDMTRHREHSYKGKKTNPKWKDCLSLHHTEIKRSKASYFAKESECLTTANSAGKDKVQTIHQMEKEIRKWRKSYRYLSNMCNSNNPNDQDAAGLCLVQNIKRDNYDIVFQRLLLLKLDAIENYLLQLNNALFDLEECLKINLSEFLDKTRNIMTTLNECYDKTNRNKDEK
ncbi:uncharacterized protein [Epargyreus clarus]|uniref:uncharacterized protein n=1 Tax=Epargyreus clarus TaxID=520877 RepID=UPI003C2C9D7D